MSNHANEVFRTKWWLSIEFSDPKSRGEYLRTCAQTMEGGSERISTPIRSPSDKDSAVLSRVSVSSSPFGFRKVSFASFVHHAQSQ